MNPELTITKKLQISNVGKNKSDGGFDSWSIYLVHSVLCEISELWVKLDEWKIMNEIK